MRAMILAAGLGTRLRPLTYVRPKALVPVMGSTPLEFWISRLHTLGFEAVVVNAFQMPERLVDAVHKRNWPIPVHLEVESELLGTGGGIRNVLDFFQGKPFVVVNGDTICDAPLPELYAQHLQSGAPASLLMHDWTPFNHVAVDEQSAIRGFGAEANACHRSVSGIRLLAFTGIHFLNPEILQAFPVCQPMDVLAVYRQLISDGSPPRALVRGDLFWREMGEIDSYWALNRELVYFTRGLPSPSRHWEKCLRPSGSLPCTRCEGDRMPGSGPRLASFGRCGIGRCHHLGPGNRAGGERASSLHCDR